MKVPRKKLPERTTEKHPSKIQIEIANVKQLDHPWENDTQGSHWRKDICIATNPSQLNVVFNEPCSLYSTPVINRRKNTAQYTTISDYTSIKQYGTYYYSTLRRYNSTGRENSSEKLLAQAVKEDLTFTSVLRTKRQTPLLQNGKLTTKTPLYKKAPLIIRDRKYSPYKIKNTPSPPTEQAIGTATPIFVYPRKDTRFWKSPLRDVGIIFHKDDSPDILKKRERLRKIILSQVKKAKASLHKKYVVSHPVTWLLERNYNKPRIQEAFLDGNKVRAELKDFQGIPRIESGIREYAKFISSTQRRALNKTCYA